MSFVQVKKMFDDLYINYPEDMNGTESLGGDIGLDSQEAVELKDLIEICYGIKLTTGLNYNTTVQEINREIREKVSENLNRKDDFYSVVTNCVVTVNASVSEVFGYIWNYNSWPQYLSHVIETIPICEDADFQEFYMNIKDNEKGEIRVRSIRRSLGEQIIDFYQPIPPADIKVLAGRWSLNEVDKNTTQIELTHKSTPDYEICSTKYKTYNKSEINTIIRNWLHQHGKTTLQTWVGILGEGYGKNS